MAQRAHRHFQEFGRVGLATLSPAERLEDVSLFHLVEMRGKVNALGR